MAHPVSQQETPMYPLIALRLVQSRNQEIERQASRARLARSIRRAVQRDVPSEMTEPTRDATGPSVPVTSAIPWRAI